MTDTDLMAGAQAEGYLDEAGHPTAKGEAAVTEVLDASLGADLAQMAPNRAEWRRRRRAERRSRLLPTALGRRWEHPLLRTLTPWARTEKSRRRAANRAARRARRLNRS